MCCDIFGLDGLSVTSVAIVRNIFKLLYNKYKLAICINSVNVNFLALYGMNDELDRFLMNLILCSNLEFKWFKMLRVLIMSDNVFLFCL